MNPVTIINIPPTVHLEAAFDVNKMMGTLGFNLLGGETAKN